MKLVYTQTQQEVKLGDVIQYVHHNDPAGTEPTPLTVVEIVKPAHGGSTGRVYVQEPGVGLIGRFPSVFDMEWIEREDQQ